MERALRRGLLGLALAESGCLGAALPAPYEANPQILALPEIVLQQDSSGALSYHASTPGGDAQLVAQGRAQGSACQRGFQIPVLWSLLVAPENRIGIGSISAGWGEGGYADALVDLRTKVPPNAVLFDVRADMRLRTILSVYAEQCLVLDAAVFVPSAGNESPTRL